MSIAQKVYEQVIKTKRPSVSLALCEKVMSFRTYWEDKKIIYKFDDGSELIDANGNIDILNNKE